jgi:hypothetical protein
MSLRVRGQSQPAVLGELLERIHRRQGPLARNPLPAQITTVGGVTAEEAHTDGGTWRGASLPQDSIAPPRLLYNDRVSCADTGNSAVNTG